jgi:hypothetical protein
LEEIKQKWLKKSDEVSKHNESIVSGWIGCVDHDEAAIAVQHLRMAMS